MCIVKYGEMDAPWGTLRIFYHFRVCRGGLGFPSRTYKFIKKE